VSKKSIVLLFETTPVNNKKEARTI